MADISFWADLVTVLGGLVAGGKSLLKLKNIEIKAGDGQENEQMKDIVSVIIDFNLKSVEQDVKNYLSAQKIDSTILVCRNKNGYVPLNNEDGDEWRDAVTEIYTVLKEISNKSPKRINIFMNAPAVLAFAIGYTLRSTCYPYIYQYNQSYTGTAVGKKYYEIMQLNDRLRG